VYKVFAKTLSPEEQRVGMIMELPPYHKPDVKNILYVTFRQTLSIFLRALKVISIVSVVFFILIYGFGGNIASLLSQNFTKPEGLAFIFAISFNMPCVSALAATAREAHSVKWTAKIGLFYTIFSLIISCVIYHLALFIF
ncbi:MAG: hypothetical protein ACFNYI_05985, partial [Eubacterium sp.]